MADTEITDVIGARMALIPAGSFLMGTRPERVQQLMSDYAIRRSELSAPEIPQHAVSLDAYYMDVHPVTNAQFRAFVEAEPDWSARRIPGELHNGNYLSHWTGDEFPTDRDDHPVVNVCWYSAHST
jgi:sulfatase modifying factor 1